MEAKGRSTFKEKLVREGGLEPPHLSAYAPQTYVATITPPAQLKIEKSKARGSLLLYKRFGAVNKFSL